MAGWKRPIILHKVVFQHLQEQWPLERCEPQLDYVLCGAAPARHQMVPSAEPDHSADAAACRPAPGGLRAPPAAQPRGAAAQDAPERGLPAASVGL